MAGAIRVLYAAAGGADAGGRAERLEAERPVLDVDAVTGEGPDDPAAGDYDCLVAAGGRSGPIELVASLREDAPSVPVVLRGEPDGDAPSIPGDGTTIRASVGEDVDGLGTVADCVVSVADQPGASPESMVPGRGRPTPRRSLERAVDALEDIFFVVGPDGEVLEYNDRLAEVTGHGDAVGSMSAADLVPDGELPTVRAEIKSSLSGEQTTVETAILTADGERVPVEVTATRLLDADGDLVGAAGIARDVSDLRDRERELAEYKRYTDRMLDAVDDLFFVHDADGRLRRWNESFASVTGYDDDEIASMTGTDFVPPAHRERTAASIGSVFETGSAQLQAPIETKDGERIPYEFSANLVTSPDGDPRLVGVGRDVTERVTRERELERQNERLEEFASIVSHDLRNPLNVAEGHLELAAEDCDSDHLDAVGRSLDRMQSIVADVLALARSGHEVDDREAVSVTAVAEAAWQQVETGGAALTADGDRTVHADPSRFQQVLENLFRNAVEHGSGDDDGAEDVTVTVGATDDGFYVADDGPGIPESERAAVFDADYSTTGDATGFGLAIVAEVADAHGWTVAVEESAAGGARFAFGGVDAA